MFERQLSFTHIDDIIIMAVHLKFLIDPRIGLRHNSSIFFLSFLKKNLV